MDLLSLGKEPINPDQPTGSDCRYEPEFDELQAEIEKLSSPSAASGIDWKKVSTLASAILAQKSKDILVASYLAVAQIYTNQIDGLLPGFCILRDLLDQFWEDLYPPKKRMGGRLAAIEWWLEKTGSALARLEPAPQPPEKIDQLKEDLGQIEKRLGEYVENPPSFISIQRALDAIPSLADEKPHEEAPPSQEKPQPTAAPDRRPQELPPSAPPEKAEDIASEKDAQRALRSSLQKIRQVAAYLNETVPMNSLSYRYTRVAAWSTVETLPPVLDGKTRIPPPAPQVVKVLHDLRQKGDWTALAKSAERRLSQFIFWLDLNRFVAEALVSLGDSYQDAHDVVCSETAFLVHRLPGLDALFFSDGMPFADPNTMEWLKGITFGADSVINESTFKVELGLTDADEDQMAETIQKAQALAKKKRFVEAVESLQEELRKSYSRKKMLQCRLALSQILMSSKQANLAAPHFEQVLEDIELYRLEEWDPDLALEVLKMVWTGFNTLKDKAYKSKAADILNRIARLDPAEALRVGNL
jgi:type VI secretion system protein VasJ